jgi:hypothetical protein
MIRRVLIFGNNMTLLMTRELILRRAGLDICITTDHTDATRILASGPVHLLILCHTLREADRSAILSVAQSLQNDLKSLILVANQSSYAAFGQDATLSTFDGPDTLLAAVCGLTHTPVPAPEDLNPSATEPDLCHSTAER